jgi:hypothetical protein
LGWDFFYFGGRFVQKETLGIFRNMLVINFIVKVNPEYINCRYCVLLGATVTYFDRAGALGTVTLFFILF